MKHFDDIHGTVLSICKIETERKEKIKPQLEYIFQSILNCSKNTSKKHEISVGKDFIWNESCYIRGCELDDASASI